MEIHLKESNGQVIVAVEDHRIGIPPEKRPHIFDRFYHLEKSCDGDALFGGIG